MVPVFTGQRQSRKFTDTMTLNDFVTNEMRRGSVFSALSMAILLVGAAAGCGSGGAGAGGDVRLPEALRQDIDPAVAARGSLSIPASAEFNFASFRSGQSGQGRGDARRIGAGGAVCRAECEPDGGAWGEFQLGYSFDNKTDRPLEATVKLRLKVAETNELKQAAPGSAEKSTIASTNLRFFIKDTFGIELKNQNLLASSMALGPKYHGKEQELIFDARFEPGRGYYLIIAGRAEVNSEQGGSVAVSVEVTDVTMEITWKPAAAAQAVHPTSDTVTKATIPDAAREP